MAAVSLVLLPVASDGTRHLDSLPAAAAAAAIAAAAAGSCIRLNAKPAPAAAAASCTHPKVEPAGRS